MFNRNPIKVLAQIQDTGLEGASFTIKMAGTHVIFELLSPHASMNILNGQPKDWKLIREALKQAEKVFNEQQKQDSGRIKADSLATKVKSKDTKITPVRKNK